ncbi:N-acetyl-D-glucosamine kinase [Posidoniimonas polymericola]|uniref:N-acetyl-D-glucosamine kinase n=1 Tax=Posidoniimonas polymericola TaxID=2528002 RepID=A0A5C5XXU0_9BACT|nr:ROK family protein [Posidoniimonas polymericola]TWT66725.1 N-acetyl-D-glucosamine kinase [Posidoniimonas polymericola]
MSTTPDNSPLVLTLDAGGTNFSFAALRDGRRVGEPVVLPAAAGNLDHSLANLFEGFTRVNEGAGGGASAISFAFPGPADYRRGVLYNVGNLPAYSGGVPLAEILSKKFGVPTLINNDGDLFALGEAAAGLLPEVNAKLEEGGGPRRYHNLIGLTLGTGFGGGIVLNGKLLQGDNSLTGEVWLLRHGFNPDVNAEEGVSIRAVTGAYAGVASDPNAGERTPQDIARIADGEIEGDAVAAKEAFAQLGHTLGDAVANLVTVLDGLVVVGGGLSKAHKLFMPALLEVVNGAFPSGRDRLVQQVYNLECPTDAAKFYEPPSPTEHAPQTGVGISRLGANDAVGIGAYTVAIDALRTSP